MRTPSQGQPPLPIPVQTASRMPAQIDPRWIDVGWVIDQQQAGRDPTARWRRRTHASLQAGYAEAPAVVAATFVAQWVVQSLCCAAVQPDRDGLRLRAVTASGPWVVIDERAGFPRLVFLDGARLAPGRGEDVHADYRHRADAFIQTYRPGIPMSSRQRRGLVHDVWQAATRWPEGDAAIRRQSCCFMYALPGLRWCSGCPRAGEVPGPSSAVGEHRPAQARSVEQS